MSEQPMPKGGKENVTHIARTQFAVMLDEQEAKGIAKYGMSLATWNGRDAHYDALAELVDAFQYVTQAMLESADNALEREQLQATLTEEQHINRTLTRTILDVQAERDRYKAALRWYADAGNYEDDAPGVRLMHPPFARCGGCDDGFHPDRGQKARGALAASTGEMP